MILTMLALAAAQPASARPAPPAPARTEAAQPFAGMKFLLGHCWQGTFADGKVDTHCFEAVYGGKLIRDRHAVTGGYAGETIYNWNADAAQAEFTYWNVAGGVSRGTMRERDGLLDFADQVYRGPDGRETRIATIWRRVGETAYEARATSSADPTNSRIVRYVRADAAPVQVSQTINGDGTRTLSHELVVPAPPEQVYAAFTSPEGWQTWAVPHAWTPAGDSDLLETSYSPAAAAGDPNNIQQRFVLRVPSRLIVFRTVQTPPRFPHSAEFKQVTSLVEMEPAGSGTRVRLSGIGYPPGAAGDTLLGFFREGNRTSLEQLRARFVTGPLDWSARQAAAK